MAFSPQPMIWLEQMYAEKLKKISVRLSLLLFAKVQFQRPVVPVYSCTDSLCSCYRLISKVHCHHVPSLLKLWKLLHTARLVSTPTSWTPSLQKGPHSDYNRAFCFHAIEGLRQVLCTRAYQFIPPYTEVTDTPIRTWNVRGIHKPLKRTEIVNILRKHQKAIIGLQEMYLKCKFSHNLTNSESTRSHILKRI